MSHLPPSHRSSASHLDGQSHRSSMSHVDGASHRSSASHLSAAPIDYEEEWHKIADQLEEVGFVTLFFAC